MIDWEGKYYQVSYGCANCRQPFKKSFKKGEAAPDKGVDCPNCGTNHATNKAY